MLIEEKKEKAHLNMSSRNNVKSQIGLILNSFPDKI